MSYHHRFRSSASVFIAFFILLFVCACAPGEELISLHGEWRWRKGFEKQWLSGKEESGRWKTLTLPLNLNTGVKELKGHKGWVTLRRELPAALAARLRAGEALALESGWVGDVVYVYLNERLIGKTGRAKPYESGYYRLILQELPFVPPGPDGDYRLTIAAYAPAQFDNDLSNSSLLMGPAKSIFRSYYQAEIITLVLISVYLMVGLYHLVLWSRRRKDKHNFWFGLFAVLVSAYWFHRTGTRDLFYGDWILARQKIEYITLFNIGPALLFFMSQYFNRKYDIMGIITLAFWNVLALVTLVSPFEYMTLCLTIWQLTALPAILYMIFYMAREALRRNVDAYFLTAGVVALMLAAIHDILAARQIINTPHLARYTFVLFVLGIAGVLANRFVRVHQQVEDLNAGLEIKVKQRTEQLQKTLNDVRALKEQQDGDYFLTSLLIKPLGGDFSRSRVVNVEILERQKKSFLFRNREQSIGGDFCIAHNIQLRGRNYVVFLNGDAMGKSIQGAGGALVLGTVFKSLITRTQMSPSVSRKFPERWLKECFVDLQNVFVSFDGSMLISVVVGLLEEDTGFMYYINAEHPWVTLYQDGKAGFIEKELILRKIGIDGLDGHLWVKTFQLKPNDVIIVGSDGRDDILLGIDDGGNRIVNEDEYQFLRMVEKGEGDLERIEAGILETGELMDDFTLMRIGYREGSAAVPPREKSPEAYRFMKEGRAFFKKEELDKAVASFEAALEMEPDNPEIMRDLGKVLIRAEKFQRAAELLTRCCELEPADVDSLYFASLAFKKGGDFEQAADYGERCRLRRPDETRNLIHLADVYRRNENYSRAGKILDMALELDPENERGLKLRSNLAAKS